MHRFALVCLLALTAVSCGEETTACSELREPMDPASALHLFDLSGLTWQTDPPTSGPHYSGPTPTGAQTESLELATQVTILEGGGAVVQYEQSVPPGDVAELERLATGPVVVAPADTLPTPVVATAWTWKLTCESVDLDAIRDFTSTRTADAPGNH